MADVYPADRTTDTGKLRVLINDTQQYPEYVPEGSSATKAYMFSDDDLGVYLALFANLHLAAAACIDALATNEALVSKKIRTEDLQTDGAAVANSLRNHAVALRAQGNDLIRDADDLESAVEIVEFMDPITKWDRFEHGAIGGLTWL